MTKKVRILTRRAGYNFGSSLQAYAMQQMVRKIGYPNLVVNYDEYHHNILWRIRPFVENILYSIFKLFSLLKTNRGKYLHFRNIQRTKFDQFDNKYVDKTTRCCRTKKELRSEMNDCYACICGSDQIWSPFLFDTNFYFDFLTNKRVKKVAYAPSLGIYDENLLTDAMAKLISDFDSISVREERGAEIVRSRTGREVETVLDPTLMLDLEDWKKIEKQYHIDGKYILCYFLGKDHIPHNFISRLRDKTGLQVVNIQMYYNVNDLSADMPLFDVSPDEFLSLVSQAEFVCTDSFHGTIFSTIYKKIFFVFDRFVADDKMNQNSRIDTLLKILNKEGRRKSDDDIIGDSDIETIDYIADTQLQYYRNLSFDYLRNNLL